MTTHAGKAPESPDFETIKLLAALGEASAIFASDGNMDLARACQEAAKRLDRFEYGERTASWLREESK